MNIIDKIEVLELEIEDLPIINDLNPIWELTGFIDEIGDKNLEFANSNIKSPNFLHKNYLEYLSICWNNHLGIAINPDVIWYVLLCELAAIIKEAPDLYRDLFTESDDKQVICVYTDDAEVLPIESIINVLKNKIPTDSDLFLPKFSTSTKNSTNAFYCAFADMCSPYYEYCMFMCGIPKIRILGNKNDWEKLQNTWIDCIGLVVDKNKELSNYALVVTSILQTILDKFDSPEFWKDIFELNRCGSGSQYEVSGWFKDLFREKPSIKFINNYPSNISIVDYKNLSTQESFSMRTGIFSSVLDNNFLIPDFGCFIYKKV